MKGKDLPNFDFGEEGGDSPRRISVASVGTETIDIKDLVPEELSASGSFDFRGVEATAFGRLLHALPIPAFLVDKRFRIIFANQSWRTACPEYHKIMNSPFTSLFPKRSRSWDPQTVVEEVLRTRKSTVKTGLLQIERKTIWGRIHFRPLRISGERGILVLIEDLTSEAKQLLMSRSHAKELQRARDNLEERVEQRTAELTTANARLQKEIKEREVAEQGLKKAQSELEERVRERTWQLTESNRKLRNEINERVRIEEALRKSTETIEALINATTDVAVLLDKKGNILALNRPGVRNFNRSLDKILGKCLFDLSSPGVAMRRRMVIERVVSSGTPLKQEARGPKGQIHENRYYPVFGSDGKVSAIAFFARDITGRRRAEASLRESEEKYRLLVENAHDAILVIQDNLIRFVNHKAIEMTGHDEDSGLSRSFTSLVHPNDQEMWRQQCETRSCTDSSQHLGTFRIIDVQGNTKWVEVNTVPVKWGERPATLTFLNDITSKRKLEEEILKIQKLESLGVLAGGIAHDFNNIMTGILGNISLARIHLSPDERAQGVLVEAENACVRARGLTQQLLTFSRGGAPVKKLSEIKGLIKDSCEFALRGSKVRCDFRLPENLWRVEVDEGQIGQVMNNLVMNADQAMPGGGVIEVQTENMTIGSNEGLPLMPGKFLRISVSDQGVGIPAEHLQRIFDPYFTTKQKGSGLGLATSHSILKNHNGLISVRSELGVGTTFDLYLPVSEATAVEKYESEQMPVHGRGRVLLMDDDDSIRGLAGEMLALLGYEPVLTRDGREAIEAYHEARKSGRPFDAVVMDLTVPGGMGGKEAIERLREIDPAVKAIVSSGYSNDPVMAEYKSFGFVEVLSKPYTAKEFSQALDGVISQPTATE